MTVHEAQLVGREEGVEGLLRVVQDVDEPRAVGTRLGEDGTDVRAAIEQGELHAHPYDAPLRCIVTLGEGAADDGDLPLLHGVGFPGVHDERQEVALVVEQVHGLLVSAPESIVRLDEDVPFEPTAVRERDLDSAPELLDSVLAHPPSVGTKRAIFKHELLRYERVARASATGYVPDVIGRLIAILVLLAANGFFVAAEFSIVRSRRSRLEAMARGGDSRARIVLRATANLAKLLSAVQFGVTLASIGIGALAEEALSHLFVQLFADWSLLARVGLGAGFGTLCALAIVTYGHVVFGELAPRGAALNHPEEVARWLVPPLLVFAWLVSPVTWLLNRSADRVLRLFGQEPAREEENVHSSQELRILVEQSQEVGALERQDAALIEGVFEFSEKNAREVMTPRTAIDALDVEATLDEAVSLVVETQRSRYPVYEETLDNIIGLVLAKDLIPLLRERPAQFTVRAMMRPVHVVPGSREVEEVLADFKRLKEHMAVVLDEYGGTAGIVTMEDLLEEIVGEILDEYDEPELPTATAPDADVLIPGSLNIGEMNERFGLEVPDDDYTTVGGFVFGALGRLPVVGDRVTASHAVFTVKAMDGRRIETLAVDLHSIGDRREKQRDN